MNPNRWIACYKLVQSPSIPDLEDKVNRLLDDLWQPYGQPTVSAHSTWVQAMVKYA